MTAGAREDDLEDLKRRVAEWLAKPETARELLETRERVKQAIAEFEEAVRVDPETLRKPVTI